MLLWRHCVCQLRSHRHRRRHRRRRFTTPVCDVHWLAAWPVDASHTPVDHLEWRYCSDYSVSDSERPSKSTLAENAANAAQTRQTGLRVNGGDLQAAAMPGRAGQGRSRPMQASPVRAVYSD